MWFKDKETFVNYTQIIPAFFLIIWVVMAIYVAYGAASYPDVENGRIYHIVVKSKDIYLTLIEESLFVGSLILGATSMLILQLIKLHYWKDVDEKTG